MTYSHRFQASRKPTVELKPSLAHWYSPPSSGMQLVEIDHHRGHRQIEEHDGQEPHDDVRGPQLAGHADPGEPDDEQDLGEREVAHAQLLLERGAVRLDPGFLLLQRHVPSRSQSRAHAARPSCRRCTRKNSLGAWKSSSPVEKEKYTVSSPMNPLEHLRHREGAPHADDDRPHAVGLLERGLGGFQYRVIPGDARRPGAVGRRARRSAARPEARAPRGGALPARTISSGS